MDTSTWLFAGLFIGLFGLAYLRYGIKQQQFMPTLAGIVLCVFPYFIDSLMLTILIGVVLLVLPFVFRF